MRKEIKKIGFCYSKTYLDGILMKKVDIVSIRKKAARSFVIPACFAAVMMSFKSDVFDENRSMHKIIAVKQKYIYTIFYAKQTLHKYKFLITQKITK